MAVGPEDEAVREEERERVAREDYWDGNGNANGSADSTTPLWGSFLMLGPINLTYGYCWHASIFLSFS